MDSSQGFSGDLERGLSALKLEVFGLNPRLQALTLAASLLPGHAAARARARLYARAGFGIGEGTRLNGVLRLSGPGDLFSRLSIGRACLIDEHCAFDLEDRIMVGDRVVLGPGVLILTSRHEAGPTERGAGLTVKAPVIIEDGALLGARCIILPGVTVGAGSVVNPGSVVSKDVAPHIRVAGTPAVQVEDLGNHERSQT